MTGAFDTIPGLLLLPYPTDTLGVAAGVAGLLVLLPKAWDVLVNPVAGASPTAGSRRSGRADRSGSAAGSRSRRCSH